MKILRWYLTLTKGVNKCDIIQVKENYQDYSKQNGKGMVMIFIYVRDSR